jgi:Fuc2NAc and GlcNAc transferase
MVSVIITGVFRQYALRKKLLDVPNARSSHEVPTPSGGGVAIVMSFLLSLTIIYYQNSLSQQIFLAFSGAGILVALIGVLDDYRPVRASRRIFVHFIASGIGLYFLGGFPPVVIGSIITDFGIVGDFFGIIFLIWLLNLFNFMDGIDGIAASEAIFLAGAAALLIAVTGGGDSISPLLLLSTACAGFLVWNWPPAKIFMGDGGSGFLGLMLGLFIILTMKTGELSLWTWLILFGFFLTDATVTLLRRVARGERWYKAHRSHAYQILSRRLGSLQKVTLLVQMANVIWLLPLAYLSSCYPESSFVLLPLAFLPILCGVYLIGAGKEGI